MIILLFLPIATGWLTLENELSDGEDIKYHKPKWSMLTASRRADK